MMGVPPYLAALLYVALGFLLGLWAGVLIAHPDNKLPEEET
jgi:ribose/xylose/arabinose/galactoside ABC-type transport system permease subunit